MRGLRTISINSSMPNYPNICLKVTHSSKVTTRTHIQAHTHRTDCSTWTTNVVDV